jgi:glucose/arabinose dehydrogenase
MVYLLVAQLLFAGPPATPSPFDGVYLEEVDDSFSSPLYVTAPAGDDRLFVVERGGTVKIVNGNDDVLPSPYLNVASLLPPSPGSEQGLLGLAFHPDFAANGKVYVSYTDSVGALVVGELVANPTADTVSTAGLRTIIRVPQPATNHNGGMILFGPDRYLYIGVGDGGGAGDPSGNGQNRNTLLGSILRINVDSDAFPGDSARNYSNPPENPFVGASGADEIWVYGLRNPWRFWIDPPTGRMYIADVGQGAREEVTVLGSGSEGSNLGWNRLEGSICYPPGASCSSTGTVLPQVDYPRSVGTSVTGGVVYRGSSIPALFGTYFYGDFPAGWVRSFVFTGSVNNHYDWRSRFGTSLVSSFGTDGHGEMYVVSLGGTVWRLRGPSVSDEIFFYRPDGTFSYYDIAPNASLGSPILSGSGYSSGWSSVTSVDLDGDGDDEMFFYRAPGVFAYYDIGPDAKLGAPINSGAGYSHKWDSIASVDLDGDGQDEMFFYDEGLGLFSYYDIRGDASLGAPLNSGEGYSPGWDAITSVDVDGDGRDEMFFYRTDGTYKYYRTRPDGSLSALLSSGIGYSSGWNTITSIDLDGDGIDEMLFYRNDGTFKYYKTKSNGSLGALIRSGTNYSSLWGSITSVNLD